MRHAHNLGRVRFGAKVEGPFKESQFAVYRGVGGLLAFAVGDVAGHVAGGELSRTKFSKCWHQVLVQLDGRFVDGCPALELVVFNNGVEQVLDTNPLRSQPPEDYKLQG